MSILKDMFRALRHDNYRYFFTGQIVSLIGMWLQAVAFSWLIYRITGSARELGQINFCGQLPVLCLVSIGGIAADRFDKRKIVICTQTAFMIMTGLLAVLTLSGVIQVWQIYILAVILGIIQAFDMPARQSLIVELVGKEDLPNAIVLNSSMVNGARLIGPAAAGLLIGEIGEGWCFALNSVSYIGVLIGLFAMRLDIKTIAEKSAGPLLRLKEGFSFAFHSFPLASLLLMLGAMSLLASPQVVLMPAAVKHILHGEADTLGYLMASSGAGALAGALLLALKKDIKGLEKIIALCMTACGAAFIAFSLSAKMWLSMMIMAPIGICIMGQMAISNTLIQSLVPDSLRGRVMSFHAMMFMGGAPIGALISGLAAERFGVQATFASAGIIMIAVGLVFMSSLRRFSVLSARMMRCTERANRRFSSKNDSAEIS